MNLLYEHKNGISFRKIEDSDAYALLSLKNESWFGTHSITLANLTNQHAWIEKINQEDIHSPRNLVLIAESERDTGISDVGVFKMTIDWVSRRTDVGWDVYSQYRKMGFGKKIVEAGKDFCFNVLNLRRLDAQILATNEASQKCAESAGFIKEGLQRKAIFKNGKYIDNLIYGLLNVYDSQQ